MLKKILIGLVVLLVVLVGAVLIVPSFVNWNDYKGQIAAEVERATGRTFEIAGDMSLQVLPSPRLTAEGVTLANAPGGEAETMLALEALEVEVALAPLISGEVQVQSVVLVGPTVYLERLADGSANWDLAPGGADTAQGGQAQEGQAEEDGPGSGAGDGAGDGGQGLAISLDSLEIENGRIVYRDLGQGTEYVAEQVEAAIAADSLQGPFTAEGSLVARGQPLNFEARSGRLGDGATPVGLELTLPDASAAALTFSGQVNADAPAAEGELQARGDDLAGLVAALAPDAELPGALSRPFTLDTTVDFGSAAQDAAPALQLAGLQLTLGDVSASGDVDVTLGEPIDGRIALNVSRLDLDALLADARGGGGGQSAAPGGFALPQGIDLGFELVVDALVYNGEVVRQVLVNGQLADGQLRLDQALALLPGGGDVSVGGTLSAAEGQPRFDGQVEAASDNLRGLMRWLEIEVPDVPADRLRRAAYSSAVAYVPSQVQLTGIVLEIDSVTARGGVTLALGQAKPAFGAGLTVDRLNLDAYLPAGGGGGPTQVAQADTQAEGEAQETGQQDEAAQPAAENPLDAFNANLNLRVGVLTYAGQQASDILLRATVQEGDLTVQTLEIGDLVGGSLTFAGTVSQLPRPIRIDDAQFQVNVPDTARLARLLQQPADGALARLGSLNASGTASGSPDGVTADIQARIPDGTLSFAGTVQNLGGASPQVRDGRIAANLSDTQRLAALADLADSPVARLGALNVQGQVAGSAQDLTLDLQGQMLGGTVGTSGRVIQGEAVRFENLRVTASGIPGQRLAQVVGPQAAALEGLGTIGLDTAMTGSLQEQLSYDTTVSLLGGQVTGRGTATNLADADMSFAFDTTVSLPRLAEALRAAGGDPVVREGVGLQASARISGTPLNLSVENLNGTLGPTQMSGNTTVNLTGARPQIAANLQVGQLPLDAILAEGPGGGGQSQRWSNEPLPLDALNAVNATVDLTAEAISSGELALANATVPLRLENGVLRLEPLTGQTLGGDLRLALVVDARNAERATIDFDIAGNDLQTQQLIPEDSEAAGRVSGPVSLQTSGNTIGGSEAQLVGNLNGQGQVNGTLTVRARAEEAVGNVLLGILGEQINEIAGVAGSVNTVFNAFAGAPSELAGTFTVENGVARTSDTSLRGRNATAQVDGILANLPEWATDMQVGLYRDQDRVEGQQTEPYLTVLLRGALDEPNVQVRGVSLRRRDEPQQQQPTGEAQPDQQQQQQEEQPRSPEDVLRDKGREVLQDLFNRLQ